MKTLQTINLTNDEALLLQQISENGEDDVSGLAQSLRMSRRHVAARLEQLKNKGLVTMQSTYDDLWVRVSVRGRRLVRYLWPEMILSY